MMRPLRRQVGLTMIELMIVVAIVSVVLLLAAPSFKKTIEMQRLRGVQDEFVTNLQYARSEAVARQVPVHIRIRPAGGGYGACYILFTDTNKAVGSWSAACDCRAAEDARCNAAPASTKEIKTVTLDPGHGIDFTLVDATKERFAFDPIFAGLIVPRSESRAEARAQGFTLTLSIDAERAIKTGISVPGRPFACAPPSSKVLIPSC
jgi:type IV fimbrial biogenesis protein FimT